MRRAPPKSPRRGTLRFVIVYFNFDDYLFIMNADIVTPKYVVSLAKDLRKNMTFSEKILLNSITFSELDLI